MSRKHYSVRLARASARPQRLTCSRASVSYSDHDRPPHERMKWPRYTNVHAPVVLCRSNRIEAEMQTRGSVLLGAFAMTALSACASVGGRATSPTSPLNSSSSQRHHSVRAVFRGEAVPEKVRRAAYRGDLAAFTLVARAASPASLPSGTKLYRIHAPSRCAVSGATLRDCFSIVPVLPGRRPAVDVSRADATYVVP